jgi:CRISPR system Cascade subunit CasA
MNSHREAAMTMENGLHYSLLDEAFIRYRNTDGQTEQVGLPQLFVALTQDHVRDFPALRPHQRHAWHAFLVQVAALALVRAAAAEPFETEQEWRTALLALTSSEPDGAAWCLVTPAVRPALLQAPVPEGRIDGWKSRSYAPDELDMLITSKNHDLKSARMRRCRPEDWLFALVSLQTQEGFLGSGNYGISRMNGGFASRPGVGVTKTLLATRIRTAEIHGLSVDEGIALLWLVPWDGVASLSFASLDPHYIEICRRVRLQVGGDGLHAIGTGTKAARVAAKEFNGVTGDPWTPADIAAAKALTITGDGFQYKLLAELLVGSNRPAAAQDLGQGHPDERLSLIAQCIARGQGKTERYHERRIPILPKIRALLLGGQQPALARVAGQRIAAIAEVRKLLWVALAVLFNNGKTDASSDDSTKDKASRFARPFEQTEDLRFFDDLNAEIEADDDGAQRAEAVLRGAFDAGPRSSVQRYRAQSAALSRFHGALRGAKFPVPELVNHYRQCANPSTGDNLDCD